MFNFLELNQRVALLAQRKNDSDYADKIKDWLNMGINFAFESYDYWSALQSTYRFSSVASTEKYFLPSDFDKPFRIIDRTNNRKLVMTTREEYYSSNISSVSSANSGIPNWAMLYGINAVSYEPTSSFTLKAKSSNSADNTGVIARVEGWLDSAKTVLGYEDISISTSTPTTYATATSPTTFYGITKYTKSADTTGFLTLADSSSNVLATIAPYDRESRFPVLYLGLIPNSVNSYDILYKRKIKKLVNDNDYPFMDMGDFLVLYATAFAFHQEKESESRATVMWQKAEEALKLLLVNEQGKFGEDFQHKMTNLTAQSHRS